MAPFDRALGADSDTLRHAHLPSPPIANTPRYSRHASVCRLAVPPQPRLTPPPRTTCTTTTCACTCACPPRVSVGALTVPLPILLNVYWFALIARKARRETPAAMWPREARPPPDTLSPLLTPASPPSRRCALSLAPSRRPKRRRRSEWPAVSWCVCADDLTRQARPATLASCSLAR